MATTKAEFKQLADELINGEFADFFSNRVFTVPGVKNPITGVVTGGVSKSISCLRADYKADQIDGLIIRSIDFKLVLLHKNVTGININAANLRVMVEGKSCLVINVSLDAADAVYTLQVRNG